MYADVVSACEAVIQIMGSTLCGPAASVYADYYPRYRALYPTLKPEFEAMAQKTGAAIVVAHHFAKGDSTAKSAMDRMSGAGAWSRGA